jgi:hypothetical protein
MPVDVVPQHEEDPIRQIVFTSHGHTHVMRYVESERADLLALLAQYASNNEMGVTWYIVSQVSQRTKDLTDENQDQIPKGLHPICSKEGWLIPQLSKGQ